MDKKAQMRIAFTTHAVERFQERVRPTLNFEACKRELHRLSEMGTFSDEVPGWLKGADQYQESYLHLTADITLTLKRQGSGWVAVTCITRDTVSEKGRAYLNRRKNRKSRRNHGRGGRRGRPPVEDNSWKQYA